MLRTLGIIDVGLVLMNRRSKTSKYSFSRKAKSEEVEGCGVAVTTVEPCLLRKLDGGSEDISDKLGGDVACITCDDEENKGVLPSSEKNTFLPRMGLGFGREVLVGPYMSLRLSWFRGPTSE
jgi:hypothetical protein